jgi:hypothetical protein
VNGTSFSYSIDLSKAFWNAYAPESGPSFIKQVPQPGKLKLSISSNYDEASNCYFYATREVNAQFGSVQPTVAQTPRPLPSAVAEKLVPSPSPTANPNADVAAVEGEMSPVWWLLIGLVAGITVLGGAEYTARRYRAKHGTKAIKK